MEPLDSLKRDRFFVPGFFPLTVWVFRLVKARESGERAFDKFHFDAFSAALRSRQAAEISLYRLGTAVRSEYAGSSLKRHVLSLPAMAAVQRIFTDSLMKRDDFVGRPAGLAAVKLPLNIVS